MKTQILVVGRHQEILDTVLRLLNNTADWEAKGTLQDNEAIRWFDQFDFDIVLLSSGISENCEDSLCRYFKDKKPSIIIIQHYGGGSGLLSNEIRQALESKDAIALNTAGYFLSWFNAPAQ